MISKYLHLPRFLYLSVVAVGIFATIFGALFFKLTSVPKEVEPSHPVKEDTFFNKLVLLGKIEAYRVVSIYAPFEGTVQLLRVNNGDRVNKNDYLLTLDTRKLDLQIREALADKLRAQKNLQELVHWKKSPEMRTAQRNIVQIRQNLNRVVRQENESNNLFVKGIIPRQELNELHLQRQTLEAELNAAQEDYLQLSIQAQGEVRDIAKMALVNASEKYEDLLKLREKKQIMAPINGTVIFNAKSSQTTDSPILIETGVHVAAGQMLLQLASSDDFKITSFVTEHDLHRIQTGLPVTLTGDGLNQHSLQGRIESISPHAVAVDDITEPAMFAVTIVLNEVPKNVIPYIRAGMLVTITLII